MCRLKAYQNKGHSVRRLKLQRGFSLLEVLVALTIAATTCGIAFSLIGQSSRTVNANQNYQTALLLAESKIAEVSASPLLWRGEHQGTFDEQFFWQANVTPYWDEHTEHLRHPFALYRIDIQVGWTVGVKPPISLSTLRLGRQL